MQKVKDDDDDKNVQKVGQAFGFCRKWRPVFFFCTFEFRTFYLLMVQDDTNWQYNSNSVKYFAIVIFG